MQTATTTTRWNTVQPVWREAYHMCVYDAAQVLKIVLAHNMETGEAHFLLSVVICVWLCAAFGEAAAAWRRLLAAFLSAE